MIITYLFSLSLFFPTSMVPSYTDADVFYGIALSWGIAPPLLLIACFATWHIVDKCMPCFQVSDIKVKIKSSCIALLYLLWPSLCSQTFGLFACRSVCDDDITYLRADLDVKCGEGRQLVYVLGLGLPMLLFYVIGLPIAAYIRVRLMNQQLITRRRTFGDDEGLSVFQHDHKVYGMFYSAFRKETWWWEGTVALRKIVIAMIGVFGAEMELMQIHFTLMLVVCVIIITAQVRPFGGLKHGMLHKLEMSSLLATFLTLWAGSIFNTLPRCEDPEKGEGITVSWCNGKIVFLFL